MGKASRDKGKRGEREVAEFLRDHGIPARRGVQYAGGADSPDVIGFEGVHIEVKRTEALRLYPALEQALRFSFALAAAICVPCALCSLVRGQLRPEGGKPA